MHFVTVSCWQHIQYLMVLRIYKQTLKFFSYIAPKLINRYCARQYRRFWISYIFHDSVGNAKGNKVLLGNLCDCFHISKAAQHMKTKSVSLAFVADKV